MNATAKLPAACFTVGQKLSDRSACDYDCIFRATVIKRTAKRVTLDFGRGEIRTVGIFIDYNGNEACFPFGRYSMASIFSADDKYIEEASAVAKGEPQQQAEMLQTASAILGVEVEEILAGGETLPVNVIFHRFR